MTSLHTRTNEFRDFPIQKFFAEKRFGNVYLNIFDKFLAVGLNPVE